MKEQSYVRGSLGRSPESRMVKRNGEMAGKTPPDGGPAQRVAGRQPREAPEPHAPGFSLSPCPRSRWEGVPRAPRSTQRKAPALEHSGSSASVPCWVSELLTGALTPRKCPKKPLGLAPAACPPCGPLGAAPSFLGTVAAPGSPAATCSLPCTAHRRQSWRQPTRPGKAAGLGTLGTPEVTDHPSPASPQPGATSEVKSNQRPQGRSVPRRRTQWPLGASTPRGGRTCEDRPRGPGRRPLALSPSVPSPHVPPVTGHGQASPDRD